MQVLESSKESIGEPMTFEVGSGDIMGNRLFMVSKRAGMGLPGGRVPPPAGPCAPLALPLQARALGP